MHSKPGATQQDAGSPCEPSSVQILRAHGATSSRRALALHEQSHRNRMVHRTIHTQLEVTKAGAPRDSNSSKTSAGLSVRAQGTGRAFNDSVLRLLENILEEPVLDRMCEAGHFDDRGTEKVVRKPSGVDSRRHNDDSQIALALATVRRAAGVRVLHEAG